MLTAPSHLTNGHETASLCPLLAQNPPEEVNGLIKGVRNAISRRIPEVMLAKPFARIVSARCFHRSQALSSSAASWGSVHLVGVCSFLSVRAFSDSPPLGIESSMELCILILMLAVCAVTFWQLARSCVRAGSNTVRLQALSSSSKATRPKAKPKSQARTRTKAECRELSSLCDKDPSAPLSPEDAKRFAVLLAKLNNAGEQAPAQPQVPTSSSEAPPREASSSPRPIRWARANATANAASCLCGC